MILVDWLVGKKVTVSLRNEKINQRAIQKTLKEQATEITNRKLNLNNYQKASVLRTVFPDNHLIPLMYEQGSVSDQMDTEVCNQLPKAIQAIWPTVDAPYDNFGEELAKVKIETAALKTKKSLLEEQIKQENAKLRCNYCYNMGQCTSCEEEEYQYKFEEERIRKEKWFEEKEDEELAIQELVDQIEDIRYLTYFRAGFL